MWEEFSDGRPVEALADRQSIAGVEGSGPLSVLSLCHCIGAKICKGMKGSAGPGLPRSIPSSRHASKRWDDCGDHDHDNGDYRSAWAEVEDDDNDVDDRDATRDGDDDGMATM